MLALLIAVAVAAAAIAGPTPPGPPPAQCLLPPFDDGKCCKPGTHDRGFNRPCDSPAFAAAHAFCNASLGHPARIDDVLSRMTAAEKAKCLGTACSIASSGLSLYDWWSEGTHGVAGSGSVARSQFAMPITTAQSFNRSLWHATGAQIGRESMALNNAGQGWSTYWAPVVNLARSPKWGRNLGEYRQSRQIAQVGP